MIGPEDWREFREVRLRALADAPAAFGSRYDDWAAAPEDRWRDRLASVPYNVVARHDGRAVGMASGTYADDGAELISMWVAPEMRGSGIAAELIRAVVGWAGEHGRPLFLMVRSDNARAIAAYQRAGFVDRGVPPDWPADRPRENRMEHLGAVVSS